MNRIDCFELLTAQPFRPFRMLLSLNIKVDVRHPEMAMLGFSTLRVERPTMPGEVPDDVIIVSLSHIVTVEYLLN